MSIDIHRVISQGCGDIGRWKAAKLWGFSGREGGEMFMVIATWFRYSQTAEAVRPETT